MCSLVRGRGRVGSGAASWNAERDQNDHGGPTALASTGEGGRGGGGCTGHPMGYADGAPARDTGAREARPMVSAGRDAIEKRYVIGSVADADVSVALSEGSPGRGASARGACGTPAGGAQDSAPVRVESPRMHARDQDVHHRPAEDRGARGRLPEERSGTALGVWYACGLPVLEDSEGQPRSRPGLDPSGPAADAAAATAQPGGSPVGEASDDALLGTPLVDAEVSDDSVLSTSLVDAEVSDDSVLSTPLVDAEVCVDPVLGTPLVDAQVSNDSVLGTPLVDAEVSDTPVLGTPLLDAEVSDDSVLGTPLGNVEAVEQSGLTVPSVDAEAGEQSASGVPPEDSEARVQSILGVPPAHAEASMHSLRSVPLAEAWPSGTLPGAGKPPTPLRTELSFGTGLDPADLGLVGPTEHGHSINQPRQIPMSMEAPAQASTHVAEAWSALVAGALSALLPGADGEGSAMHEASSEADGILSRLPPARLGASTGSTGEASLPSTCAPADEFFLDPLKLCSSAQGPMPADEFFLDPLKPCTSAQGPLPAGHSSPSRGEGQRSAASKDSPETQACIELDGPGQPMPMGMNHSVHMPHQATSMPRQATQRPQRPSNVTLDLACLASPELSPGAIAEAGSNETLETDASSAGSTPAPRLPARTADTGAVSVHREQHAKRQQDGQTRGQTLIGLSRSGTPPASSPQAERRPPGLPLSPCKTTHVLDVRAWGPEAMQSLCNSRAAGGQAGMPRQQGLRPDQQSQQDSSHGSRRRRRQLQSLLLREHFAWSDSIALDAAGRQSASPKPETVSRQTALLASKDLSSFGELSALVASGNSVAYWSSAAANPDTPADVKLAADTRVHGNRHFGRQGLQRSRGGGGGHDEPNAGVCVGPEGLGPSACPMRLEDTKHTQWSGSASSTDTSIQAGSPISEGTPQGSLSPLMIDSPGHMSDRGAPNAARVVLSPALTARLGPFETSAAHSPRRRVRGLRRQRGQQGQFMQSAERGTDARGVRLDNPKTDRKDHNWHHNDRGYALYKAENMKDTLRTPPVLPQGSPLSSEGHSPTELMSAWRMPSISDTRGWAQTEPMAGRAEADHGQPGTGRSGEASPQSAGEWGGECQQREMTGKAENGSHLSPLTGSEGAWSISPRARLGRPMEERGSSKGGSLRGGFPPLFMEEGHSGSFLAWTESQSPRAAQKGKGVTAPRSGTFRIRPQLDSILGKPHSDIGEEYKVCDEEIGSGKYGVIRKCQELKSGRVYACKTLQKAQVMGKDEVTALRTEVASLAMLKGHPSVVSIKGTFEDPREVHIVMEYCAGGDLFKRISSKGRLAEADAAKMLASLVRALAHCHSLGIMHRDVKPENVLLTQPDCDHDIKLTDFGVSSLFQPGKRLHEIAGTHEYMAPEVLRKRYGPEADIWSAGVLMYVALSGLQPFWASTKQGLLEAIMERDVSFKSSRWAHVSEGAKDLLRKMLAKAPQDRISSEDILQHPWIQANT